MAALLRNARYSHSGSPLDLASAKLRGLIGRLLVKDMVFGGSYRIYGPTTEMSAPGPYHVLLYDRRTLQLVRKQWSDAGGNYQFDYIAYAAKGYFVIQQDHGSNPLNAAIADFVTPEPMP